MSQNNELIQRSIAEAVGAVSGLSIDRVSEHEDVFGSLGLSSMQTFRVLVHLENALDVVIGERSQEFAVIRTLGGLRGLLGEKLSER